MINAPATINVRLPSAAVFDKATQDGTAARVRFQLPPVLRFGIEYRTDVGDESDIRVEAAYVREFWSALSQKADVLVMGAYGHARWHEFILGGATKSLLSRPPLPILLSH